jgi:hypothetical protein
MKTYFNRLLNYAIDAVELGIGLVFIALGAKWLKNDVEQDFGE